MITQNTESNDLFFDQFPCDYDITYTAFKINNETYEEESLPDFIKID